MAKKILLEAENGEITMCHSQQAAAQIIGCTPTLVGKYAEESLFMTKENAPDDWMNNPAHWRNFPQPIVGKDGRKWFVTEVAMITDEQGNVTWKRAETNKFPCYMVDGFKTLICKERAAEIVNADRAARAARQAKKKKG